MRQCRLNFADNRYDCEAGIIGEHYATELIVTPPAIMPTEAVYRLCFEPGGLSEIILQTTDGAFSYPLPSAVTATSCCCVTLIGYVGSEQVYKSRMVRLRFSQTADGDNSIDLQQPGIVDEVNQNTAARHSHANKAVLDKFAESKDGKPTYDGKALGGGASDFTIKMAVASGEDGYTVTSCDATVEQIDAAVAAKKRVVLIATDTASGLFWEMPIIFGSQGNSYEFGTFLEGQVIVSFVDKVGENESKWQFMLTKIAAEAVDYSNAALSYVSTVGGALDELVPKSHTHDNKDTLDKLSASDGILTYDGKSVDGSEDFIIQMTINDAGELVSCKTTFGQVDAAYKAGKNPIVQATVSTSDGDMDCLLPLVVASPNEVYAFGLINYMSTVYATVVSPDIDPDLEWEYSERNFGNELADLSKNSHTHDNKAVLDLLSAADGKLKYNGSDVGLKGDKGDKGDPGSDANVTKTNVVNALGYTPQAVSTKVATGTNITLADNTEYRLTDVTTLTLNYPTGDFECWMRLKFAASGNITVTLPADTKYIGTAPDFKNGETWELSFKDKVLAAQKVGEGT